MKICWKALQWPVMSAQQNKKTRPATNADNIVSNLIDFLGDDWKDQNADWKKKYL